VLDGGRVVLVWPDLLPELAYRDEALLTHGPQAKSGAAQVAVLDLEHAHARHFELITGLRRRKQETPFTLEVGVPGPRAHTPMVPPPGLFARRWSIGGWAVIGRCEESVCDELNLVAVVVFQVGGVVVRTAGERMSVLEHQVPALSSCVLNQLVKASAGSGVEREVVDPGAASLVRALDQRWGLLEHDVGRAEPVAHAVAP